MREEVDQLWQVVAYPLCGLLGGLVVLRHLVAVLQEADRLVVSAADVLVGVLFVEQFGEGLVGPGAAVGQGPRGIGRVEAAQHGGHQRGAGQGVQTRALESGHELQHVVVGAGQVAEASPRVRTEFGEGEPLQFEADGGGAQPVEFPVGQGPGGHHEAVHERLRLGLPSQPVQQGDAGGLVRNLIETVDHHQPGRPGPRVVAEEVLGECFTQPEDAEVPGHGRRERLRQDRGAGQVRGTYQDRNRRVGPAAFLAVQPVVGRVSEVATQQGRLADARAGHEDPDAVLAREDVLGGHEGGLSPGTWGLGLDTLANVDLGERG
ncbi:hypothetical protein ACQUSR_32985 [Streptomyces sp. P1-3]|uniref:hypothetical protein n=1 Tax=Streptomyces sp. P1-3 TaxID=3421658 RepID=UPI003D36E3FD